MMETEFQAKPAATGKINFTSTTEWVDGEPDCLVLCCSDHRFEPQIRDLARNLGFSSPHVIQFPSGPALTLPLVASSGFLSQAVEKIVEMTAELKRANAIICVAHQGCGAYGVAGKNRFISFGVKHFTGRSVSDLQREHLSKAARRVKLITKVETVRAFLAEAVDVGEGKKRVCFKEIP